MSEIQPTINPALPSTANELDSLCKLIREEKVLLWVGSGFSSYAGYPTGTQIPQIMLASLGDLPGGAPDPATASLQEAADYYVEQRERNGLNSFLVEQYRKEPSRCDIHESLALINRVTYVVTTNYDPLFERAYGDRMVVVSRDEHLPGSTEYPDKTILLKIHGDITQPDSIIITSEDYEKFDSDTIVWSKIRSLLAEYSVVFIGYSLHDPNVEKMLHGIYSRLKGKKHPYFFISRTIDANKQSDLAAYDLHYIQMNATGAIEYITENTIQNSLIDSLEHPSLFPKTDQIFSHKGFRLDRTFAGGKITKTSIVPTKSDTKIRFTLSLSPKSGRMEELNSFHALVLGNSFEPVSLTESRCGISIRNANINDVLLFHPSMERIQELSITPQPNEIVTVDLQLQNQPVRLNDLKMGVFRSKNSVKLEIQDPDFTFSLAANLTTRVNTLNFSSKPLLQNIDRAKQIYSLFNGMLKGNALELLWDRFPSPLVLNSSPTIEYNADATLFRGLLSLYTDLSDIQNILHLKLHLPDIISPEECDTIHRLATFLRGKGYKIDDISTTFGITDRIRDILVKNEPSTFRIEGNDVRLRDKYELFGKKLAVPYVIDGSDVIVANPDEVQQEIERGESDLHIKWKSVTGNLLIKYNPSPFRKTLPTDNITEGCP